ncbi:hypothetical protein CROQUDRAFT_133397 [Cronartium quercuum f. sp. fusiforme G11]|uniref:Uncharacterized protein n=1 Tax=Cronartium quercuum f. sp. fusiforme G11 TaxID=708437 RepID=A0A9P6NFP5_9BASI|nr:hypothetical protein CROQUDRAFT_133397 [Cronartium quercuum f. sp. fusiforme G11]
MRIHNLHNQLSQYGMEDLKIALLSKLLAIFLMNGVEKVYNYITVPFYADISNLKVQTVFDHLVMETMKQSSSGVPATAFAAQIVSPSPPSLSNEKNGPKAGDLCNLDAHAGLHHMNWNCPTQLNQKHHAKTAGTSVPLTLSKAEMAKWYQANVAAHKAKKTSPVPPSFATAAHNDFNAKEFTSSFLDEGYEAQAYAVKTTMGNGSSKAILADTATTSNMVNDHTMFLSMMPLAMPIKITGIMYLIVSSKSKTVSRIYLEEDQNPSL